MAYRVPESLNRLARKGTARSIGNSTRDHDAARHRLKAGNPYRSFTFGISFYGEKGRLGVQGIKYGFNQ
jgi:hypothetical protein